MCTLNHLPDEILFSLLSHLSLREGGRMSMVCKRWKRVIGVGDSLPVFLEVWEDCSDQRFTSSIRIIIGEKRPLPSMTEIPILYGMDWKGNYHHILLHLPGRDLLSILEKTNRYPFITNGSWFSDQREIATFSLGEERCYLVDSSGDGYTCCTRVVVEYGHPGGWKDPPPLTEEEIEETFLRKQIFSIERIRRVGHFLTISLSSEGEIITIYEGREESLTLLPSLREEWFVHLRVQDYCEDIICGCENDESQLLTFLRHVGRYSWERRWD